MGDRLKALVAEGSIWMAANLICSAAALLVTYLAVTLTSGGHAILATALTVAGVVLLTWGSWISLSWTRVRPLRAGMKGITLVPGLLLLTAAGVGFYVGLGSLLYWIMLIASAVGTLAVTLLLWRFMPRTGARRTRGNLAVGFLLYPVATALGATVVGWAWYWFITDPMMTDWRNLLSMATVAITVLAAELTTTVIPAAFSMTCCQAHGLWRE